MQHSVLANIFFSLALSWCAVADATPTTLTTKKAAATASAAPTCAALKALPNSFYIHSSGKASGSYLAVDLSGKVSSNGYKLKEVSCKAGATIFYGGAEPDVSNSAPQLAFNTTNSTSGATTTYEAWRNTQDNSIRFFKGSPQSSTTQYDAVVAAVSYDTCNLVLRDAEDKYADTVWDCNGVPSLVDAGFSGTQSPSGCTKMTPTVLKAASGAKNKIPSSSSCAAASA